MKFVKFQGHLWAYEPAPNRFRKWYRAIEKTEAMLDRGTWDAAADRSVLTQKYWDENRARVDAEIGEAYPAMIEPRLVLGFEASYSLGIAAPPHEWFILGRVDPAIFGYAEIVGATPSQPRPAAFSSLYCAPSERPTRRAEHDAYVQRWELEWSKF